MKLNSSGTVIEWTKALGGSYGDYPSSIEQTTDGGYIVAGASTSNNGDVSGNHGFFSNDAWIVKLSSIGVIEWQKCLGGTGDDGANSVKQTFDGRYIVAGYTLSNDGNVSGNHGGSDYWVVKLNSSGTVIEWTATLGGSGEDRAYTVQQCQTVVRWWRDIPILMTVM